MIFYQNQQFYHSDLTYNDNNGDDDYDDSISSITIPSNQSFWYEDASMTRDNDYSYDE